MENRTDESAAMVIASGTHAAGRPGDGRAPGFGPCADRDGPRHDLQDEAAVGARVDLRRAAQRSTSGR